MTAASLAELQPAASACATCGATLLITRDAIGRTRTRCPACVGVAKPHIHPDEVFVSQTITPSAAPLLPPIKKGQLRCQVCAKGVDSKKRFCPPCSDARKVTFRPDVHCSGCGSLLPRDRKRGAVICASCEQKRKTPFCPRCGKSYEAYKVKGRRSRICKACR